MSPVLCTLGGEYGNESWCTRWCFSNINLTAVINVGRTLDKPEGPNAPREGSFSACIHHILVAQ